MIYIFLGADTLSKDRKIDEIKSTHNIINDALRFDYEVFNASKLNPVDLKKSLNALPIIAGKRLVIVHSIKKLSTHNKEIILEFDDKKQDHAVVVLDSDDPNISNSFINKLSKKNKILRFKTEAQENVFDMTRAMTSGDSVRVMKILNNLLENGNHPLQIMGGLVWFWGKSKNRLRTENFEKGLLMLQEADLNIKRSRLIPENALEVLIVKLMRLINT